MLYVVAASVVGDVVPYIAVAGLGTPFAVDHFVDNGQVQGHDGVATLLCDEVLDIVARDIVGDVVPCETIIGHL